MATLAQPDITKVSTTELVQLCALDSDLYCQTFFPKTYRQASPPFHRDMWDLLEDRSHRYVALEVFRGGAKTATLRTFSSKRLAYGISRTQLFVSESQDHSRKSLSWLRSQIERNQLWTTVFGLVKGDKWNEDFIEVINRPLDIKMAVIAVGITGQIRGLNVEDYRPDLIVADDPCSEENTGSPELRQKVSNLFFGALEKSLTPATECPEAKQVLLQTPLNGDDLISQCQVDSQWASRKYGCFDNEGRSRWEVRFPTETLLAAKRAHIARNQLPLWLREMECTIVSGETSLLQEKWLKFWEPHTLPKGMAVYVGLDPVPPPSEREIAMGMAKKDSEVISAVGVSGGDYYLLEYISNKGHTPEWTKAEFFRLVDKWRPIKARVEGIAYQKTLKWILEEEMKRRGRYVQIDAAADRRSKQHRITQAFSGIGSQGRLYVHPTQIEFIQQFASYPNCKHDDVLDSAAMAVDAAQSLPVDMDEGQPDERLVPALETDWRIAP